MSTARAFHTATVLLDGTVLITGGLSSTFGLPAQASAEIYDPAAGQFLSTGSMSVGRFMHAATLLQDGSILITGGSTDATVVALDSTEVYRPTPDSASPSGTFTPFAPMTVARSSHTATRLPDGRVLVAGGQPNSQLTNIQFQTAEICCGLRSVSGPQPSWNPSLTLQSVATVLCGYRRHDCPARRAQRDDASERTDTDGRRLRLYDGRTSPDQGGGALRSDHVNL